SYNINTNETRFLFNTPLLRQIEILQNKIIVISENLMLYEYHFLDGVIETKLLSTTEFPLGKPILCMERMNNDVYIFGNEYIVYGLSNNKVRFSKISGINLPHRVKTMSYYDSTIAYISTNEIGIYDFRNKKQSK